MRVVPVNDACFAWIGPTPWRLPYVVNVPPTVIGPPESSAPRHPNVSAVIGPATERAPVTAPFPTSTSPVTLTVPSATQVSA